MGTSSGIPGYSFDFSADVVDNFICKYWRATATVGTSLGLSTSDMRRSLINAFMRNQPRWKCLRDTIKRCTEPEQLALLRCLSKTEAIKYLTSVRSIAEDYLIDHGEL